jgi:hypothetical protein
MAHGTDFSNKDGLFPVSHAALRRTKVYPLDDFYPMDIAIPSQYRRNRPGTPFALVSFL